jgi:hypothetical protein
MDPVFEDWTFEGLGVAQLWLSKRGCPFSPHRHIAFFVKAM